MIKTNKGITLIALVITLIVLIILAGISIAVLTGEDGLITKAKQGAQNYQNAEIEEQERLNTLYGEMNSSLTTGSTNNNGTPVNQGTAGSGLTQADKEWLQQLINGIGSSGSSLTEEEHGWLEKLGSTPHKLYDWNPDEVSAEQFLIGQGNRHICSFPVAGYSRLKRWHTNSSYTTSAYVLIYDYSGNYRRVNTYASGTHHEIELTESDSHVVVKNSSGVDTYNWYASLFI